MIDFNKEIKLSDLIASTKKKAGGQSKAASPVNRRSVRRAKTPNELVGLKIGATQLAAARVVNNGTPHVRELARQPLPEGIVAGGEVRDIPALAAGLNEFFTVNNLPRRGVRLGIATNHVGVRIFEIAGIDDDDQLANAVLFRAHDAVSIPIDEAVIDYRVIGEDVDAGGTTTRRILLVAAYREPIERFAEACREAGVQLYGVDLEAFGLLRALSPPLGEGEHLNAAVVAVTVGHERTTLAVSDGEICQFTRVLEWGGARLVAAIARVLHLSSHDAQQLLLEISLGPAPAPGESEQVGSAREAATRELQALGRELVSSLEFYQGQPGSLPIAEVLVAGGTSRIPGFAEELERLTRVRVRRADPLARVEVEDGVGDRDDLASLAVAIGLGVED